MGEGQAASSVGMLNNRMKILNHMKNTMPPRECPPGWACSFAKQLDKDQCIKFYNMDVKPKALAKKKSTMQSFKFSNEVSSIKM